MSCSCSNVRASAPRAAYAGPVAAAAPAATAMPAASYRAATGAGSGAVTTARAAATGVATPVARSAAPATTAAPTRDYWSVHLSQYRNRFNPNGPAMAPNCGPASVAMALRMIGLDVPGAQGARDQRVIDRARIIATGRNDTRVGTTDTELERVVNAAGGRWSESTNLEQLLGWARQGTPVILAGNPSQAWNRRYSSGQVYPFDGGHWVVVSGYDARTGWYVVNDPLSAIGPIYVSREELATYFSRNGGLGIGVSR